VVPGLFTNSELIECQHGGRLAWALGNVYEFGILFIFLRPPGNGYDIAFPALWVNIGQGEQGILLRSGHIIQPHFFLQSSLSVSRQGCRRCYTERGESFRRSIDRMRQAKLILCRRSTNSELVNKPGTKRPPQSARR
jgi:hypothetical protein